VLWWQLEQAATLRSSTIVLVRSASRQNGSTAPLSNFFIAAAPRHPFFKLAITRMSERHRDHRGVLYATGGYLLQDVLDEYNANLRNHCPRGVSRLAGVTVLTHDEWASSFAAHHWLSTWQQGGHDWLELPGPPLGLSWFKPTP